MLTVHGASSGNSPSHSYGPPYKVKLKECYHVPEHRFQPVSHTVEDHISVFPLDEVFIIEAPDIGAEPALAELLAYVPPDIPTVLTLIPSSPLPLSSQTEAQAPSDLTSIQDSSDHTTQYLTRPRRERNLPSHYQDIDMS